MIVRAAALMALVLLPGCVFSGLVFPAAGRPYTTEWRIEDLRTAIEWFEAGTDSLPVELSTACFPTPRGGCSDLRQLGFREEDGWGTLLRYRRLGDDYEVRSAGRDRRMDTDDDIVVLRSRERRIVAERAGCWRLSTRLALLDTLVITLSADALAPGIYKAAPTFRPYWDPRWRAGGDGSIEVTWREVHSVITMHLRPGESPERLEGTVGSSRGRTHPVTAAATACG
jgi:hypothetical protein